jgi:hypothetical protein
MIRFSIKPVDILWMFLALAAGAVVIYVGERVLNVSLSIFYGISTFNPIWAMNLILVPILAGLVVSFIYGLGGKMLAHFAPIPVQVYQYMDMSAQTLPDGVSVLPVGYWILILIVCVEAAAVGGFIGEVIIKRTYGRRPKHLVHKRYQPKEVEDSKT